jgi:hypothetical protein
MVARGCLLPLSESHIRSHAGMVGRPQSVNTPVLLPVTDDNGMDRLEEIRPLGAFAAICSGVERQAELICCLISGVFSSQFGQKRSFKSSPIRAFEGMLRNSGRNVCVSCPRENSQNSHGNLRLHRWANNFYKPEIFPQCEDE